MMLKLDNRFRFMAFDKNIKLLNGMLGGAKRYQFSSKLIMSKGLIHTVTGNVALSHLGLDTDCK